MPKDLRIDTFCSSGPGGQSVNTTYSAVRITHLPTNVVVSMQDEKSQIKNREKAMRVLRARLQELEEQKQHEAVASERRSMVGSGDRSEKIRTYNFKENRVTDHRIGLTIHQLDQVMEGNLDEFIQALTTHYESEKLKREAVAPHSERFRFLRPSFNMVRDEPGNRRDVRVPRPHCLVRNDNPRQERSRMARTCGVICV